LCSELVWAIDRISANSDAHAVEIILLGLMVYDNAGVGDGAVFGDVPDFVMGEKQDSVSASSDTFFSLRQLMEFLGYCRYPKWTEDWILHELGVLCDGFFDHGVNNPAAHLLRINTAEDAIGQPGNLARNASKPILG
jgi:hypothetical protein